MADRRHCVAEPLPCLKHRNYRCIAWRTGGGRFSCECPGEKESESQQITRYLGSHAPRKPANSPEETEPKERERRRGKGDRNNHRDARTFLIYERAYFLGLLHMDIRAKRWHAARRAEVDAKIGRAHRLEL